MNYIYTISSSQFPDRVYVGSCIGRFSSRRAKHIRDLHRGKHHSAKLQNHYNKYGESDLIFKTVEDIDCSCSLIRAEQRWMDKLNPYFNIRKIAESNLGLKHTEETKAKISAWSRQRRHSDETKKKISEVQKSKIISLDTRERMSQAKIGKKRGPYKTRNNEAIILLETN